MHAQGEHAKPQFGLKVEIFLLWNDSAENVITVFIVFHAVIVEGYRFLII